MKYKIIHSFNKTKTGYVCDVHHWRELQQMLQRLFQSSFLYTNTTVTSMDC